MIKHEGGEKIRRQLITSKTKILIPLLLLGLLFTLSCMDDVSATEWSVGNDSSYDYTSIQDAISNANTLDDDTINVNPNGTESYRENVVVNKRLTIKANGEVTVTALDSSKSVFRIVNDATGDGSGSTIQGFTVTGVPVGSTTTNGAIHLATGVTGCSIIGNTVTGNWGGNTYTRF